MRYIDLRSDTVTHPTQAMRDAMYTAEVGDDVFIDDPTVKELEALAAEMLGKEAALFVTSGCQGNNICVMGNTRRGDDVIVGPGCHIATHEMGAYALLAGVSLSVCEADKGVMDPASVRALIRDDSDSLTAPTTLICVENAHSNGNVIPLEIMREIYEIAKEHHIPVHLDGARLFNAAAALGIDDVREMTQYCDTINCCLSKGLCAPVGSVIAGSKEFIARARRIRKMLGGGLRQAGILAAAGKIALTEMTKRVGEDHENARKLAGLLDAIPSVHMKLDQMKINMMFFDTDWSDEKKAGFPAFMLERGIKVTGYMDGEFRMVTHHDVQEEDLPVIADAVREYAES